MIIYQDVIILKTLLPIALKKDEMHLQYIPAKSICIFMAYGFPSSSASKESTCNAGDPGLIPRLGRSAREGIGYPFQYSWASLVAQLVKNPLVMRETWVRSLSWEDPLEKGTDTHSSILPWRIP